MRTIYNKLVRSTLAEVVDPAVTAVIAIDLQNDAVHPEGVCARSGFDMSGMLALVPACQTFMSEARRAGVPIFHARMTDLPDGRSASPAWLRTKLIIGSNQSDEQRAPLECMVEGTWGADFADGCEPQQGEAIVTKHRSSAFVGTALNLLLHAAGVETVVVIGEQTPGCVEATLRNAAYLDYYTVLVENCVAAYRKDLHDASILLCRARHDVAASGQITDIWRAGAP